MIEFFTKANEVRQYLLTDKIKTDSLPLQTKVYICICLLLARFKKEVSSDKNFLPKMCIT